MSETAVAKTVQKLVSVWKIKNVAKTGRKKNGSKDHSQHIEDIRKRRNLYAEIFSESSDVLKRVLARNSDWLLPFLQDALVECKNGDASSYVVQLTKAFSECDYLPPSIVSEEIEKNLQDMADSVIESINDQKYSAEGSSLAIQLWAFVTKILSKRIIACSDTTNIICSVFAQGLKSSKVLIVQQSLSSWCALIEAFSMDPNWHVVRKSSNDKRLELILRALRHKVTPEASIQIFETWWFLAESLCERLPLLFEQVIHGLLRFCVGGETLYFPQSDDENQIAEMVSKPLSLNCKLVSLLSETLHLIKYSRAITNVVPELIPKLHLLLDAILSRDGIFAHAFTQAEVVQLHSTFLIQCIRWVSFNVLPESEIALSLPGLWLSLSEKIIGVLSGEALQREMKLFMAQLYAWVQESKHGNSLANETIALLQSVDVFGGYESDYQKIKGVLLGISKNTSGLATSFERSDVSANSVDSNLLKNIVDEIFTDSALPPSPSDLNSPISVNLSPSVNEGSQDAVSNSIGMSNITVDEVLQPCSLPISFTSGTSCDKNLDSKTEIMATSCDTLRTVPRGEAIDDSESDVSIEIISSSAKVETAIEQLEQPESSGKNAVRESQTLEYYELIFSDIIEETPDVHAATHASSINQTISNKSECAASAARFNLAELTSFDGVFGHGGVVEAAEENLNPSVSSEISLGAPSMPASSALPTIPKSATLIGFTDKPETPGILRKADSPKNSHKRNLRVHFVPDDVEGDSNLVAEEASTKSNESACKLSLPLQKRGGVVQNRKRLFGSAGEGMSSAAENDPLQGLDKSSPEKSLVSLNLPCSPPLKKNKLSSVFFTKPVSSSTSFMPELIQSDEPIHQLCRSLSSGSTAALVLHLHNKKIFTVGAFASMTEDEVVLLPIKMPQKLEKVREIMSKLYLGRPEAPFHIQSAPTADVPAEFVVENLSDHKELEERPAKEGLSTAQLVEDSMGADGLSERASATAIEISENKGTSFSGQIKESWNRLKGMLSWADDPSVVIEQKSALEMIIALNRCLNEVSQTMHGSI